MKILKYIFIIFIVLLCSNPLFSATGLRCDFDNDGVTNIKDVVYEYAFVELGSATPQMVASRAAELYSPANEVITYMPSPSIDDLNGDGTITIADVVYFYASIELGSSATISTVQARATELYSAISGSVTALPGESVTR